jgi:hypothetical protein
VLDSNRARAQRGMSMLRDVAESGDDKREVDRRSDRNVPAQS